MKKKILILLLLSFSTQILYAYHKPQTYKEHYSACMRGSAISCLKVSKYLMKKMKKNKHCSVSGLDCSFILVDTLSSGCRASASNAKKRRAKQESCRLRKRHHQFLNKKDEEDEIL